MAAIVATAVITADGGGGASGPDKNAERAAGRRRPALATASAPEPSFSSVAPPPPPDPKDYIADAKKDTAPVTVGRPLPRQEADHGRPRLRQGRHRRARRTAPRPPRAPSARSSTSNGCDQVIRATYSKDGIAVTVGVAVFGTEAEAKKAAQQATGGIASAQRRGRPDLLPRRSGLPATANSYGRYAYFTVGGFTSGKNVTTADKAVYAVGDDLADFTFRQIRHRGEVQASAAAGAPAT